MQQAQHMLLGAWFLGWQPLPCSLLLKHLEDNCSGAGPAVSSACTSWGDPWILSLLLHSPLLLLWASWRLPESPHRPEAPEQRGYREGKRAGFFSISAAGWKRTWVTSPVLHSAAGHGDIYQRCSAGHWPSPCSDPKPTSPCHTRAVQQCRTKSGYSVYLGQVQICFALVHLVIFE